MELNPQPNAKALLEAFELSNELLKNIELSELPLSTIVLKASRLARLLNDFDHQKVFELEASGYPHTPSGMPQEAWELAKIAKRRFFEKDKDGTTKEYSYLESIEELEEMIESSKLRMEAAKDPSVSISSANPHQFVNQGAGNTFERKIIQEQISKSSKRLSSRKSLIYQYVLQKNYELSYSGIASDAFSRIRESVDSTIGTKIPSTVQKFSAIYQNLNSENPEDWSNAVHGCRRILQDLADAVFPSQAIDRTVCINGKDKTIKLGADNYINRLVCYVEDNSSSDRFQQIVGSHIGFLGDRLDSIFQAAQKGSHSTISTRTEADRYVVYTYLAVADILSINPSSSPSS